jgi:hypothetical protein
LETSILTVVRYPYNCSKRSKRKNFLKTKYPDLPPKYFVKVLKVSHIPF